METDELEQEVDTRELEDETSSPDDKQTDGNDNEQQKTEADEENTNDGTDKLEDGEQPKVNGCSSPSFCCIQETKKWPLWADITERKHSREFGGNQKLMQNPP